MLLHVDVANVTGALRVYESVGMRAVLEIDAWAKGERVEAPTHRLTRVWCGGVRREPLSRGALLPAYVGHDNLLTIGSRERVATATMTADSSGSPMTTAPTSSHGTARKWSGIGAPCASVVPASQR